jgi:mRNA interferase HigB
MASSHILSPMHIVSLRFLRDFWREHPAAEGVLRHWHSIAETTVFDAFNDLRRPYQSADYVAPYTIFNVGGNNYRLIALIHYGARRIYIRGVVTHADYDRWRDDYRRG